jgi:SAM-dependent methyltransferase
VTTRTDARPLADAYVGHTRDAVREAFEREFFARELERLLAEAPGAHVLDLGCGDGLVAELGGDRLERYLGVDLQPPAGAWKRGFLAHDLGEGLGPVGAEPFDLYFASFGVVSHLAPAAVERLCREIAAHARPGALVALEALGLFSLEWPALWETDPGPRRTLSYRLAAETEVHPWAPDELNAIFETAGITPLRTHDRTVQAGPKVDEGAYWRGLPPVRSALNRLLGGSSDGLDDLGLPLPPLPAHPIHPVARVHHGLAARRRALVRCVRRRAPEAVARAVWALEPKTGGGFGHGLLAVGRVR